MCRPVGRGQGLAARPMDRVGVQVSELREQQQHTAGRTHGRRSAVRKPDGGNVWTFSFNCFYFIKYLNSVGSRATSF